MTASATPAAPTAAAAPPSAAEMIAAIRDVQRREAATIGSLCVVAQRAGTAPAVTELVAATGLIAALDLAADVLTAALLAGLA